MKHAAAKLSPEAQACLTAYPWPGNVRELDNAIQRALILQQGGLIQPQDFCLSGAVTFTPLPITAPVIREVEIEADSSGALGDDLRRREFQMIIDTLRAERGRRKEAAEKLGISPRTLRYKLAQMRDAGMDVEGYLFAT
jgi:two-component system response regulator FlrC